MSERGASDLPDLSGLPQGVLADDLKPGKSIIHRSTNGTEIFQLLKLFRLDQKGGGMTVPEMLENLFVEWPELKDQGLTEAKLRSFIETYVDPAMTIENHFFRKGMMRGNNELNHIARVAEIAKEMDDAWMESRSMVGQVGEDGKPIGPTVSEHLSNGEKVIRAYEKQGELAAQIGMAPTPKSKGITVNVPIQNNVDLRAAAGGFAGPVVDVKPKEKAREEPKKETS